MKIMLQITALGGIAMLQDDEVNLSEFGRVEVTRASNVEFDNATQRWYVQSAKTGEMLRADFVTRAEALAWEKEFYSPTGSGWGELLTKG